MSGRLGSLTRVDGLHCVRSAIVNRQQRNYAVTVLRSFLFQTNHFLDYRLHTRGSLPFPFSPPVCLPHKQLDLGVPPFWTARQHASLALCQSRKRLPFLPFLEVVWTEGVQYAGVICLPVEQEPRGLCQLTLESTAIVGSSTPSTG